MNNPRIGSLVQFGQYCYYGVLVNKIGLVIEKGARSSITNDAIYKVLVEEVIYEAYVEEFEPI